MFGRLIKQFLYYPVKLQADAQPPSYIVGAEQQWFRTLDGNTIHALFWRAPEGRPTVLFLHGNAQSVYDWALMREDLRSVDCGLLVIDYPGYGKSSGAPSEQSLYAAGRAALAWLTDEQGLSPQEIIVHGKSLGGGVAAEICMNQELLGIILESTFTSILAVIKAWVPIIPASATIKEERYDSIAKLQALKSPILVIHGSADRLIPIHEGKKLYEAAPEPKRLYIVEGAGHNDVAAVAGLAYGRTIKEWLASFYGERFRQSKVNL